MQDKSHETTAPDQEDIAETLPEASPDVTDVPAEPVSAQEDTAAQGDIDTEEEEDEVQPAQDRVFGMTRFCFRGTALGLALGMILAGLLKIHSATAVIIAGGALGFFICSRIEKKRKTDN